MGNEYKDEKELGYNTLIPSTDAGEIYLTASKEITTKRVHVSGHFILNQCGTMLDKAKTPNQISSKHQLFLQNIFRLLLASLCRYYTQTERVLHQLSGRRPKTTVLF